MVKICVRVLDAPDRTLVHEHITRMDLNCRRVRVFLLRRRLLVVVEHHVGDLLLKALRLMRVKSSARRRRLSLSHRDFWPMFHSFVHCTGRMGLSLKLFESLLRGHGFVESARVCALVKAHDLMGGREHELATRILPHIFTAILTGTHCGLVLHRRD